MEKQLIIYKSELLYDAENLLTKIQRSRKELNGLVSHEINPSDNDMDRSILMRSMDASFENVVQRISPYIISRDPPSFIESGFAWKEAGQNDNFYIDRMKERPLVVDKRRVVGTFKGASFRMKIANADRLKISGIALDGSFTMDYCRRDGSVIKSVVVEEAPVVTTYGNVSYIILRCTDQEKQGSVFIDLTLSMDAYYGSFTPMPFYASFAGDEPRGDKSVIPYLFVANVEAETSDSNGKNKITLDQGEILTIIDSTKSINPYMYEDLTSSTYWGNEDSGYNRIVFSPARKKTEIEVGTGWICIIDKSSYAYDDRNSPAWNRFEWKSFYNDSNSFIAITNASDHHGLIRFKNLSEESLLAAGYASYRTYSCDPLILSFDPNEPVYLKKISHVLITSSVPYELKHIDGEEVIKSVIRNNGCEIHSHKRSSDDLIKLDGDYYLLLDFSGPENAWNAFINAIHEYCVRTILHDWLSITHPQEAANHYQFAMLAMNSIKKYVTQRTGSVKRLGHMF